MNTTDARDSVERISDRLWELQRSLSKTWSSSKHLSVHQVRAWAEEALALHGPVKRMEDRLAAIRQAPAAEPATSETTYHGSEMFNRIQQQARDFNAALKVQACRPEDRAMLATPAGQELLKAAVAAMGNLPDAHPPAADEAQVGAGVPERVLELLSEVEVIEQHDDNGPGSIQAVVVENDWPEYEPTWKAIEARVDGTRPPAVSNGEALLKAAIALRDDMLNRAENYEQPAARKVVAAGNSAWSNFTAAIRNATREPK